MELARPARVSNWAFGVAFAVAFYFFYEVVAPFVLPVLVGGFIVVLTFPANEWLAARLGGRRRLAAALSAAGVFLLVLTPIALLGVWLVGQGIELLGRAREALGEGLLERVLRFEPPERLRGLLERLDPDAMAEQLRQRLAGAAAFLGAQLGGLFGATARLLLDGFLTLISTYYFFVDGPALLRELSRLLPLELRYQREFFGEFRDVAHAMLYVHAVTAALQGLLGAIAFAALGLPTPHVFAGLIAVLSFVPALGTGLVWVPASIVLLISGRTVAGLLLFAWGLFVIGSVDNVLKPILARGRMRLHPLLVFLTVFGGLAAFGPAGIVLGPLAGSLFMALVRIWGRDFAPKLAG